MAARRARAPGPNGAVCVLCVCVCRRVDMVVPGGTTCRSLRRFCACSWPVPAAILRVLVACPPARLPAALSSRGERERSEREGEEREREVPLAVLDGGSVAAGAAAGGGAYQT